MFTLPQLPARPRSHSRSPVRLTAVSWSLLAVVALSGSLAAQETRFSPEMQSGDRLEIQNINGTVSVTQGRGTTAEIIATKQVRAGNGDLVIPRLETGPGYVRICTVYRHQEQDRADCRGEHSTGPRRRGERLDVRVDYQVRLPAGVSITAATVNGDVVLRGLERPATVSTVNGSIDLDGAGARRIETVNGRIVARLNRSDWTGDLTVTTVNGSISLTLPEHFDADISGETVNGRIDVAELPIRVHGKWGMKSFAGQLGRGDRRLRLTTVSGSITLRQQ